MLNPTNPDTMVTVELSDKVFEVLAMDEDSICRDVYRVTKMDAGRKGMTRFTMSRKGAYLMLWDCDERSSAAGGYDQPLWYYKTARAAAKRLQAALTQ